MNRLLFLAWLSCVAGLAQSAPPTNAVPADALALRRFEWIPPFATPRTVAAQFPRTSPVTAVEAMTLAGGQLWAAIRPRAQANLPAGTGRLWAYSDRTGFLEPVRGPLQEHTVNTLFGTPDQLWLGLNGGLAALDLGRLAIHPFGPAQGIVSTNIVGIGQVEGTVIALGRFGLLWGLPTGTTNFIRAGGAAPPADPRAPEPWQRFTTSGDWMLAGGATEIAARHIRAQQWLPLRAELANGSPRLTPPQFTALEGDGEGGFWVGSDAGLHWVNPESNVVENRFAPLTVTVPGGLGMSVAPGFQPTGAAYALARDRVMGGIRERMRDRARRARANADLQEPVNPLWPTSRMPGGVTALHRDGRFLWVATSDGPNSRQSRVLLLHQPTRRWVGWFPVAAPVNCLAADSQRLWIGLADGRPPGLSPLFVVDKLPLVSVPQVKWTRDAISPEELGAKLAALPVKERAVLAFFGGDSKKVIELLAPDGEAAPTADAETLFLLAFVNDAVGLHRPDRLDYFVGRLRTEFPDSPYAELAGAVRSARPAAVVPEEAPIPATIPETIPAPPEPPEAPVVEPPPVVTTPVPEAVPPNAASPRAAVVLLKRDLSKDGTLNVVEFRLWRGPKADFDSADTNHDGRIDAEEIDRVLEAETAPPP